MSETTLSTSTRRNALDTWAVLLSSLLIAVPILVSSLVEAIFDSSNPADIDITQGLAYLREILGFSFGSLGVLIVLIVVVFVMIYRRDKTLRTLRLPLLILVVQLLVGVAILLLNAVVNAAETAYSALG